MDSCCKDVETDSVSYREGFSINYHNISSSSSTIASHTSGNEKPNVSTSNPKIGRPPATVATRVHPDVISQRCSIGLTGSSNGVCIEGHPKKHNGHKK